MPHKHLESALVAGSLIESGLSESFRYTRVRFAHHYYPPGYECHQSGPTVVNRRRQVDALKQQSIYRQHSTNNQEDDPNAANNNQGGPEGDEPVCGCRCGDPSAPSRNRRDSYFDIDDDDTIKQCLDPNRFAECQHQTRDYEARYPWRSLGDDFGVHCVQFSPDGRDLLAGSASTSIRVVHTADGTQKLLPRPSKWTLGMPITAIRYVPTRYVHVVACNSQGEIFAFQPHKEGFETIITEPQQTYTLDISCDGSEMATGGNDRKIRIYRLNPGSVVGLPTELGKSASSIDLTGVNGDCCENRNSLGSASGLADNRNAAGPKHTRLSFAGGRPDQIVDKTNKPYLQASCYSLRQAGHAGGGVCEPIAFQKGCSPSLLGYLATSPGINITDGHSMRIMALRFHPQRANILFSAGWDNQVKIWDTRLQSGPVGQIFGPHVASPDGLAIDGDYVMTASWRASNSIELWDTRKLTLTTQYPSTPAASTVTDEQRSVSTDRSNPSRASKPLIKGVTTIVTPDGEKYRSNPCTHSSVTATSQPVQYIPLSGPSWGALPMTERGEYPYACCFLGQHAIGAAGSGFKEVRIASRDSLMPIAQVPVDSVVQSMNSVLEGRYIGCGCSSGTVTIIGLA